MEVLQIQSVVPYLINRRTVERFFSYLEFNYKHNGTNQHNGVDSPTHPWNIEFQEQRTIQTNETTPKKFNLS